MTFFLGPELYTECLMSSLIYECSDSYSHFFKKEQNLCDLVKCVLPNGFYVFFKTDCYGFKTLLMLSNLFVLKEF